jgi:hypothetical protein
MIGKAKEGLALPTMWDCTFGADYSILLPLTSDCGISLVPRRCLPSPEASRRPRNPGFPVNPVQANAAISAGLFTSAGSLGVKMCLS